MSNYFLNRQAIKAFGTKAPEPKKDQKPVKKVSEKRTVEQKEYVKIVKELATISDRCEIKVPGCTGKMTGCHHKQKRTPANFLNKNNLLRACDSCQLWIELHPLESIEMGFSISKHKKAA